MKNPLERLPIGDFARGLAEATDDAEIFAVTQSIRPLAKKFADDDENLRIETSKKIEINSLAAVIIDRILDSIIENIPNFPPYGFRDINGFPRVLFTENNAHLAPAFRDCITSTMLFYLLDAIKNPREYNLIPVVQRFEILYSSLENFEDEESSVFIRRGIGTASQVAMNIFVLAHTFAATSSTTSLKIA